MHVRGSGGGSGEARRGRVRRGACTPTDARRALCRCRGSSGLRGPSVRGATTTTGTTTTTTTGTGGKGDDTVLLTSTARFTVSGDKDNDSIDVEGVSLGAPVFGGDGTDNITNRGNGTTVFFGVNDND